MGHAGQWALLDNGSWAVEEKDTGAFVGSTGFVNAKRDIEPSLEGMPEMGWALSPSARGKGYATEAARAALAWGDVRFGKTTMVCIIHPENRASIRVAEKIGFRFWRNGIYRNEPTAIFTRETV